MDDCKQSVLLISMPFAGIEIPSIQLPILEKYLDDRKIRCSTLHVYLKAAEIYGLEFYNLLTSYPNSPYFAQIAYSKYVFPKYWNKNEDKIKNFFKKNIKENKQKSYDYYIKKTGVFFNYVLNKLDWKSYDIIGFSLNYGQFLPSLAVAKKIKEINPNKKIIFGGGRSVGQLGVNVLESFDFVDFIVSGDGEDALYSLANDFDSYELIPNLIYRSDDKVRFNNSDYNVDINNSSVLSYDPFFDLLYTCSDEIQQFYSLYGKLPVEISRGCWWNKCSFCSLNLQHKKYREKNVGNIVSEIQNLSDKYKILNFQLIGNTLPKKNYRVLLERLKNLGKDYSFFVEARADQLKSDDYKLLKDAGFIQIQVGVESFSKSYLKKMNKGVRVIDNVASLKFCKEHGISNSYNLIVGYPNEEKIDFHETKKNIELFKQYLDPPQICNLVLEYGSVIYKNPEEYNIEEYINNPVDKIIFPKEFLDRGFCFAYDFKRKKDFIDNDWEKLIADWKKNRNSYISNLIEGQRLVDRLVFFYVDGGSFIKIFDYRNRDNLQIFILDSVERDIFLRCIDIVSFEDLQSCFSDVPDFQLAAILHGFEKNGILFKEDNFYFCLPLSYNKIMNINNKEEINTLVYSSGMNRNL